MRKYLARRLVQNVLTFFLFLTIVYFLLDAQPGDFSNIFLNDPRLTAEQRQLLRHNLGLDRPAWERYLIWLRNFMRGDFGISFSNYPRPVLDVIAERVPRTIVLFLSSTVVSFYLGFIAGKVLAWRRGGLLEYVTTIGGVALYTVFLPWFALMMIWLFAYTLGWFPIGKFVDPILWREAPFAANYVFLRMLATGLIGSVVLFLWVFSTRRLDPVGRARLRWLGVGLVLLTIVVYWLFFTEGAARYALDILHHLILPIVTLAAISFAGTMLLTRSSMLETLREDYVLAARAKGLPEKVVRDKHAARNALLPVFTSFIFSLAGVLNGGVITEKTFSWPGMGLTLLKAANTQDIPTTVGVLVFTGALTLTAHFVADILYAYLDPRVRYA
jgi:peptide/nickel transport system permease protein